MDVLGRSSAANYFTPVRDHFADVEPHPALGVKAQLVRLVANLVYGHRVNQDHVRRLDVLASILACCNIDARNPRQLRSCFMFKTSVILIQFPAEVPLALYGLTSLW